MNKKGLGRGLSSLFSDYDDENDFVEVPKKQITQSTENITSSKQELPIDEIERNVDQPRKKFDDKSLSELAQSIKTHGVVQPIIVVKRGNKYIIVAGERRWRAAKLVGLKTLPAIVRDYTDREIAEISIIENLQREDLNPIESAKAIKELIEKYDLTQEGVADKIGKSRPAVANTLRLLTLSEDVVALIEEGRLSAGHARTLIPIEDKHMQMELAKLACDSQISVRELEKLIKKYQTPSFKTNISKSQSLEIKDFTKKLQDIFATKVSIVGNDKKGKICINYYNKDDLDRIYTLLNK